MGNLIMVLGRSGSGKSRSLKGFGKGECGVFSVAHKRLPFKGELPVDTRPTYARIEASLRQNKLRAYVVDDANYLMAFKNFELAEIKGYDKFVTMAKDFETLLLCAANTSEDTNVYFLMHSDLDSEGREKPKTIGRMLDEKLCVEGMFPIVIDARVRVDDEGTHYEFVTRNDGYNLAKAPEGMLPEVMPNDLKAVDTAIRDYWGMGPIVAEANDNKSKEQ